MVPAHQELNGLVVQAERWERRGQARRTDGGKSRQGGVIGKFRNWFHRSFEIASTRWRSDSVRCGQSGSRARKGKRVRRNTSTAVYSATRSGGVRLAAREQPCST